MQRKSDGAARREPTGLNVLGETMAEYYQRRTNEAAREIERLRGALRDVRTFLANPGWGTARYMEGSDVYTDKDGALRTIAVALGEEDVSNEQ